MCIRDRMCGCRGAKSKFSLRPPAPVVYFVDTSLQGGDGRVHGNGVAQSRIGVLPRFGRTLPFHRVFAKAARAHIAPMDGPHCLRVCPSAPKFGKPVQHKPFQPLQNATQSMVPRSASPLFKQFSCRGSMPAHIRNGDVSMVFRCKFWVDKCTFKRIIKAID